MLGSGLNLVTTVIGFGMSATFIVFVCARLICGRAARADGEAAAAARSAPPHPAAAAFDFDFDFRSDLDRPIEHARGGLEPVAVAAIPTMKYNHDVFHSRDDAQCSICLGEYKEKEVLRVMPTCRHCFHLACIDIWLRKQTTCPICRISLKNLPSGKGLASPARGIPQLFGHPESSGNRSTQWLLPIRRDHTGGTENSPAMQDSIELVIGVQHEIRGHGYRD